MNVVLKVGESGPGKGHALPVLPRDKKLLPVTYTTCMETISTVTVLVKDVTWSRLHVALNRLKLACVEGRTTGWHLAPDLAEQAVVPPGQRQVPISRAVSPATATQGAWLPRATKRSWFPLALAQGRGTPLSASFLPPPT